MSDNTAQIDFWNGQAGDTWVRAQERMDAMLNGLTAETIRRAAPLPGERIIDVGCGCGATSIALAELGADVRGVDISEPMLKRARERASGFENVRFSVDDAASAAFTADHQLVFSRFGVMFFADPVAAFRNLHGALSDGGRLVFLCWQAAAANPWVAIAGRAVQPFLPAPESPPDPRAPGPFAFAEEAYVREIVDSAGFKDVAVEALTGELNVGATVDEAMEFQSEIGPISRVLAELDEEPRQQALAAARHSLEPYADDQGVRLSAACWVVSARA
jgi:SAM-dependent methyltransferase